MTTHPSTRVLGFDDSDNVVDVNDALFLEPYISGSHRYARSVFLSRVRHDATLLPPGTAPSRVAVLDRVRSVLASGPGWALCVVRWSDGRARVSVTATTEELTREVVAKATAGARGEPVRRDTVPIGFWHLGPHQPVRSERAVQFEAWAQIRRNYPAAAARALDGLMTRSRPAVRGKLLLLHGPPGTGKTTALRTLADRWRSWCQFDFVLDPERMFAEPSYLMSVALRDDEDEDEDTGDADSDGAGPAIPGSPKRRSRMLVLEDCDELVAAGAKARAGQGLSRLLNVTDGLLGQGLSLMVAITTNEPIGRLHPAVVRPGRCIAHVEIGRLSRREAADWLGRDPGNADGFTLAELVGRGAAADPGPRASGARTGQYL